jgi:hypothetical protein
MKVKKGRPFFLEKIYKAFPQHRKILSNEGLICIARSSAVAALHLFSPVPVAIVCHSSYF